MKQADTLRVYAMSCLEQMKIQIPALTFINEAGIQKYIGWSFFNEEHNMIALDMKKGIYNTSGFASLFRERNKLITDIFITSLEMILAHETAHVARGHWNLRIKEPEFSTKRNVMMNCEINADWTAMKWLLNELLYDTVDGKPHSPILAYTKNHLIYLWSVCVFSAYLSLSWGYREEDRIWTTQTVNRFKADKKATHPIYQLVEHRTREGDIHKEPFMIACEKQARDELAEIEMEWPEIKIRGSSASQEVKK